jgi:small-conductance mechanosensitive channel
MILQADGPGGAIEKLLRNLGVPYAESIAAVLVFVLVFLVIFVVGRAVLGRLADRVFDARDLGQHARNPLQYLITFSILFVAVAVAFGFAGFGSILNSLATVAAAATLAIGFALQNVVANFVAGVFIFSDHSFRIGDWIEWDDHSGIVEDISMRVTRVRTFDNELLTVPNSNLTEGVIKNPVAKGRLRLRFLFGIGYDDDIEKASEIIVEEAEKHEGILDDPAPTVRLTELAESSVGLQSRIWIDDPSRTDFVKIRGEYVTAVKRRFDEEGIDIPYPIRTMDGGISVTEGAEPTPADN